MSDTSTERRRRTAVFVHSLLWWTLLGLCSAGHRPLQGWVRGPRHTRHQDRIQNPSVNDQGSQWWHFPSFQDRGQTVQYPQVNDSDASGQLQKCAPGYFRDGSGPYLGRCVPCECNGLATECEDRTGRCLNCQYNTAGDRCERCKEGYYGNPFRRTCTICPCPFSVATNSFSVGCREIGEEIQCVCKLGYTGDRCERCSPGFYGDPLIPGGSCQPCKCNGNGNNCDPRTGVCKNTLEPGDINTDDQCQECDNCAQTLLHDLEKLDENLIRIKTLMGNASASSSSYERLKKLEKALADTKILVNKYSSSVNSQKSRINQLQEDMSSLEDDIGLLKDKTEDKAADANKAVADIEKTHTRAKALDSEIKNMLKKIQALLDQMRETSTSGEHPSNENLTKLLEEAQRLVKEMEQRDFTPQKTAAEKEREEAKKLLDYIKTNFSSQCDQNEAAAKKIREQLKNYEAKLKDLDSALKEAKDLVEQANTQNNLSDQGLKDLLKRIEDLKKEQKTVLDQIDMAENELQKTEDMVKMLSDSKMEYEQLAAQLDGAKMDLIKKVNDLSTAAAKEDIVVAAEEHAGNLSKIAKELEDAVKNASDRAELRNAKDAIDAYKNITDAINAAEAAANEAKEAAENALNNVKNQKLTERAKDLTQTGEDLLGNAKDSEKDLKTASDDLAALKKRLQNADEKKKALEKDLLAAQNDLNNIKRDDIANMLDEAKRKAAAANDTAKNTMDRVDAIRKEMDKFNVSSVDSNLNSVMDDVDESVKKLLNTIPSLTDKISEVENLTSEFSQLNNITENIKKIKDLIEQARDAANRIGIPMKFNGEGYVELRTPKDLEDLKAYTSVSLSLQRPEGRGDGKRRRRQTREKQDMFVMYLGNRDSSKNYIGMVLRDNILYGVYKLNGVEYQMESGYITKSIPEQSKFDQVDLRRIYQDAELVLTKDIMASTPSDPIISNAQGKETKNLLEISPSDIVFYVGGYPANFTPPASLNYPMYKGCIEFVSFNDRLISLYNFQTAYKVNPEIPCKRQVRPVESDYFEGFGYGKLNILKVGTFIIVDMTLYSRSENGLLFFIGTEEKYFAVTIEKGVVFLHSNSLIGQPTYTSSKIFPMNDWADAVIVLTSKGLITVRIASQNVIRANADLNLNDFTECFIGGVPQDIRERHNITAQPFKGCMKNLKLDKEFKPIDEPVGISKGCPVESLVSRKAEFSLGSSLSSDLAGFSLANDVTVSLGFRSTENQGLLLQDKQLANGMNLALDNGYVTLAFNNKMWRSNKQYNDGQWHYLTMTRRGESVEFYVDDEDKGQEQSGGMTIPNTNGVMFLGKDKFKGCVTNFYTRRPDNLYKAEDLSAFKTSGDVLLDVCSAHSPAQLMLDRTSNREGVMQAVNDTVSMCALPSMVPHAYRLGGPVSSLSYSLPLQVLQPRPHFSLDVKTRSQEGLLFFAATRGGRAHLALYMSKGRIRLSVGKEKEIFNREKYNDGKWHSVMFSLEKKKFRLVVDGIRALDGQLTSAELTSMQQFLSPVYLGSVPELLHQQLKWKTLPKHSVSGCIRNFKMNGASMTEPSANHGAGPCFEGQTQKGAYFSGNGAHVIVNDSFVLGSSFELLFNIRPRSPTGLLLHVGDSNLTRYGPVMGHYLTVYMLRGEVVAQVNNGKGEFMVSVKPKSTLCDGTFHKISVIKRKNVVQLHVDTVDNYKIGPPLSVTPLTKNPLYLGGIPDMTRKHTLPVKSSFVGCIDDMKINGEPVSFNRLSAVFGPVNLKECPAG